MSARLTMPASKRAQRRGLLTKDTHPDVVRATLVELSEYSKSKFPETPVFFSPDLVGYDSASSRLGWDEVTGPELRGLERLELYSEWAVKAFGTNAAGVQHRQRLGLFLTETVPWVGKSEEAWKSQVWHAWGACLFADESEKKSRQGKILVIFDSNVEPTILSDSWTKGHPDSETDLEPKQRSLLDHLRQKRKHNITQVWYGGAGNTPEGSCLPLAYDWCARVIEAQGLPTDAAELTRLGYYHLTKKTGARGQVARERKKYFKKDEGGDGRGKKQAGGTDSRREGLRSRSRGPKM